MDSSLTPDLSSAIAQLGQYYPLTGSQEQAGGGAGMAGMLGGENSADYSGELSGIRGLVDKGLGQITSLSQANSVLGGQINAFGGTLTGIQGQQGQMNAAVNDLKSQQAAATQQQNAMKGALDGAVSQINGIGTQVTGINTGIGTLQTNDASQTAYMLRLGKALEQVKSGIKV